MRLTPSQLAFYSENGYVVIDKVFSEKQISDMSTLSAEIAEESKTFIAESKGETVGKLRGTNVVLSMNSQSQQAIKRVVWAAAAKPPLLALGRDQGILEPVSQLLCSDVADHLINQLHYKNPGDEVSFPWHQDEQNRRHFDPDWEDVNKMGSFVQSLTAIDPCTESNGALYVLPGSHRWVPNGYLNFGKFLETDELQAHLKSKTIDVDVIAAKKPLVMNPGDVVFMHPDLVHGSWPNLSLKPRRMFINGFSFPGANHKPYPGVGSAKRISLTTGQEVLLDNELQAKPLLFNQPPTPGSVSTSVQIEATKQQLSQMVGVFCSADDRIPEEFKLEAFKLGQALAKEKLKLTTGGPKTGLMKAIIDGFNTEGSRENSHGVLPKALQKYDIHHPDISSQNLSWTETIHERLDAFIKKCDYMVVLPGGFGTLHELLDFLVHQQFGLIQKKIILLNMSDYWSPLLQQFKKMIEVNALHPNHLKLLVVVDSIEGCVKAISKDCLTATPEKDEDEKFNGGLEDRYWEKKERPTIKSPKYTVS